MLHLLRKLHYGARMLLSARECEQETLQLHGVPVVLMHAGKGPPFVYLHSTLGESLRWLPFYSGWTRDFTVYVPTHPGFGNSGGFDQIDRIEDMAFHYVELFDALGFEDVILGGVSLGGWIAAEFAARWPERVKGLWISGAPGMHVPQVQLPDLFRYLTQPAKIRELLFYEPEGSVARMIVTDEPDNDRRLMAYQSMSVLARLVWERPYSPKLASRLRRVRCPVLLLWGEQDHLVPTAYGEAYHRALPQAHWQIIPRCGHLGMFEKESAFVEAILRFAKELEKKS